jgi:hypothetical protein
MLKKFARDSFDVLNADGSTVFYRVLWEYGMRIWAGFIWPSSCKLKF